MGGCESAELRTQFAKSRDIDKELKKIPNNFQQKLLLLGPGESGKSTCLKQMQILNSHGFSDAELEDKKIIVYLNTIQNMVVLVEEMEKRGISFKSAACKSDAGLLRKRAEVKEILMFTPEVRDAIKRLWADEGVRQCYEARSDFQFVDSAVFFFEEIDRVSEEGFRPTPEDILHTRVATSGVVQVNFTIKNINFESAMGGCESAELRTQFAKSRDIDKELKKIPNNFQQKLLLLGPGESGKSTCLKQMQILNSHGFSDAELEDKKIIVYLNTIQNMVVLVEEMEKRGISFKSAACKSDAGLLRKRAEVKEILMFTPEVRDAIKRLWADEGVRQCYEARSDFQFVDSAVFFFEEIDRVSEEGFRPTPEDILHTRVATSGVVQVNFTIKNINFEVYDVGGQRSERRKWIHCFDDVNGIIFVAAISEYDQRIREDNRTNRLTEALELYDNVLNARFFDRASSILFLNKKDLFAAKITRTSLKICFPTYKGGLNYEDGIRHIKKEFNRLVKRDKKVYIHETCATDTNQVQVVINSVIDTIIQENLKDTGMI